MPKFEMMFIGRPSNSLGRFSLRFATIEADTREQAIMKLYEKFEHVSNLRTKDMSEGEDAKWTTGW